MSTKNTSRFMPLIIAISVVAGILIGTFYARHFAGNKLGIINSSSNKLNALLRVIDDLYVDTANICGMAFSTKSVMLTVSTYWSSITRSKAFSFWTRKWA